MLPITYYLIANPLIALGLAILMLLCIVNVLRRHAQVAVGIWLVIMVTLVFVYIQAAAERQAAPDPVELEIVPE